MVEKNKDEKLNKKSKKDNKEGKEKKEIKNLEDYKTLGEGTKLKQDEKKEGDKEVKEKKLDKKESQSAVIKGVDKKKKDKKKEKKVSVEFERVYIIPLRKSFLKVPRYKRAKKAVKKIKGFLVRHMKIRDRDLNKIKIDINLNNEIWFRGIKKPPGKIKVRALKKSDGLVYAELVEVPDIVKFKLAREEKKKAKVEEIKKQKKEKEKTEKEEKPKEKEEKTDEKEKEKASAEASLKRQEKAAKTMKHIAKAKTGKEDKGAIRRKAMKR